MARKWTENVLKMARNSEMKSNKTGMLEWAAIEQQKVQESFGEKKPWISNPLGPKLAQTRK